MKLWDLEFRGSGFGSGSEDGFRGYTWGLKECKRGRVQGFTGSWGPQKGFGRRMRMFVMSDSQFRYLRKRKQREN